MRQRNQRSVAHQGLAIGITAIFLVAGACGQAPEDDDASSDQTAGTEDPEVVLQARALTPPKDAPFGSLGGVCGKDWVKCQTSEQQTAVFKKLKKTVGKVTISRPSASETVAKFNVTVPRLVNDHSGKNDVLGVTHSLAESGPNRVGSTIILSRNGVDVWRFSGTVTEEGYSVGDSRAVIHGRLGGVEVYAVASLDPAIYKTITTANWTALASSGGDNCNYNKHRCIGCHAFKLGVLFGAGLLGGTIGLAGGAGPAGAAIGAGLGLAAGAAVSAQFDCNPICGRWKCNQQYCGCVTSNGETYGNSRSCSMSLSMCCYSNQASFCTQNQAGCYVCR